jgi:hypothetical protein
VYTLDTEGNGAVSFLVDGKVVGGGGAPELATQLGLTLPVRIRLAAGEHSLEVRFLTSSYDTKLFIYWQQPGRDRELLLPSALGPG